MAQVFQGSLGLAPSFSTALSGNTIENSPIGAVTANTGRFTTVNSTSTTDSSSTSTGAIVTAGGIGCAKTAYFGTGISLPTAGGTASLLNFYEQFSQSLTFGGGVSSTTVTVYITRIGNGCIIQVPAVLGTASGTGATIDSTTSLPSRFRPANDAAVGISVFTSSSNQMGILFVGSDGIVRIFLPGGGGFSTTGTVGSTINGSFAYPLN